MPAHNVKQLSETTKTKLQEAIVKLETYLNHSELRTLNSDGNEEMNVFYRGFLSDMRHLLVFAEVVYEKLGVLLRRPALNEDQAEKVLYDTYQSVVNAFFYPRNECYSEDGRYAYTGQDAIRFRKKPNRDSRDLVLQLSKIFEELREDLAYYENDYLTQKRMQGDKV